jgi:hypothetical protein
MTVRESIEREMHALWEYCNARQVEFENDELDGCQLVPLTENAMRSALTRIARLAAEEAALDVLNRYFFSNRRTKQTLGDQSYALTDTITKLLRDEAE